MQNREDNPPAFPQPMCADGNIGNVDSQTAGGGLSMRDYFAAAALQGLLAQFTLHDCAQMPPNENYANTAYTIADAMLKAREPKQTPSTEA